MTPKVRTFAALLAATLTITSCPAYGRRMLLTSLLPWTSSSCSFPPTADLSRRKEIAYVRRFADPMTDKRYSNLGSSIQTEPIIAANYGQPQRRFFRAGRPTAAPGIPLRC